MFSTKALSGDSRTVAIIRDIVKDKIEKTVWFTEKTRTLDMSKAGDFSKEIKKYMIGDSLDYHKYQFEPIPHNRVSVTFPRFVNYYLASSNSGKSYSIARYCKRYLEAFPDNHIVYVSANPLDNDTNYIPIRSKMKEVNLMQMDQVVDFTEFRDVLFVFDDCDAAISTGMEDLDERLTEDVISELSVTDRNKARKMLRDKAKTIPGLIKDSVECLMKLGRKNNISLCVVGHKANDGLEQMNILNEATAVVLFPYSISNLILINFLKNKLNFSMADAKDLSALEWFQHDFLYVNMKGKPFIITPDTIKLF